MPLSRTALTCLFTAMFALAPHVTAETIPPRAALGLLLPAALKVVEDIENERGAHYSDSELVRILHSREFQERFQLEALSESLTQRCVRVTCSEA